MAIAFTGAGGLYVALGHALGILLDINKFRSVATPIPMIPPDTTPAVPPKFDTWVADYATGAGGLPNRYVIDGVYSARSSFQGAFKGILTTIQTAAINTVVQAVIDDAENTGLMPIPAVGDIKTAMSLVIAQMQGKYGGTTSHVTASSVSISAQTNIGSPVGSYAASGNSGPVIVTSNKDGAGLNLDYVATETVVFTTTADSYSGGKTKWQEQIKAVGQAPVTDMLSYLWPNGGGNGSAATLAAVDANQSNQATGNVLQSGEFTVATTANYPDNWVKDVGVIATTILQGTISYRSDLTKCLEFAGDGATATSVYQPFNTAASTGAGSGGTPFNIGASPDRPFAVNLWVRVDVQPATGTLVIDLTDGTGTVIADDQSANNTFSQALTGLTGGTWYNVHGVFRLPANPPAVVRLRLHLSTFLSGGSNLFISHVAMTPMTQLYTSGAGAIGTSGGPFVAVFSGNTAPVLNDAWYITFTETWGNWQQGFQRLFNMTSLGLRLPTTGGAAISDTVGGAGLIV